MDGYTLLNMDFNSYDNKGIKADAIIMDPPYGLTRSGYDKEMVKVEDVLRFAEDNLRDGGRLISFCDIRLASRYVERLPRGWGLFDLIWNKTTPTGFLNAKRMPLRDHEIILVMTKPGGLRTYNPQKTTGHPRKVSKASSKDKCKDTNIYGKAGHTDYDSTERYPRSVLRFKTDKQKLAIHPSQKPIALMRWIVRSFTDEGNLVIDPTAGSGSTGIACLDENRNCVMIERDKDYFDSMMARFLDYSS